jgi:hypothetical protein
VIRKVSGLTWDDFVEDKIFDPLDMKNSNTSTAAFKDEMNIADTSDIIIDRAHRIGARQTGPNARPRSIIAKLSNQRSHDTIFKNVRSLKDKDFSLQQQLPTEVVERRKRLWQKYKDAKKNTKNDVKWNLDKLVINGTSYTAYDDHQEINPEVLEEFNIDVKHTQHVTEDGSTFMGHSANIEDKSEIPAVMASIMQDRSLATATHNIYAYRISKGLGLYEEGFRDDGEHGAGFKMLKYMQDEDKADCILIVTRWFGNKPMGPKRFDCILQCADDAAKLLLSE